MPKLCQFENCKKRASYATTYGKPERCKEHREERKLQYIICQCGKANPYFNNPGETHAMYCSSCKTDGMVDVKNKICPCGKHPFFNNPGEKTAICCSSCKTDGMVNVRSKRCQCRKALPIFNNPGEKTPICCVLCKTDGMVDVIHPRCQCGKATPYFNNPSEKTPICCVSCKTDGMVNIRSKKCQCSKAVPTFNNPGETTAICCISCKTDEMVNVLDKRCHCRKAVPLYNTPGETIAIYCNSCKTDGMIDIKNKRCKGQDGTCTITGNFKYKGYCTFCFANTFPTDPLTFQIHSKTKEIAVRDFINAHFEGFSHDKPMYTAHCDCSIRRRIDHRKLIGNTMLAIETDENQHKSYDAMDEEIRYDDLFNAFSGKWVYIRFNPDKFRNKAGVSKNPTIATRLIELKTEIERQIQRIEAEENTELLEIKYMYYNGYA